MSDAFKPAILDVLQHSSVGIAVIDLSGQFRFVNEGFAKLHGIHVDEIIGRSFRDYSIDLGRFEQIHQEFVRGERDEFKDDVLLKPELGLRWLSVEVSVVRDVDGKPESMVVVATDITRRKQAEQKTEEMAARLNAIHHSDAIGMHYFSDGGKLCEPNEALIAMAGLTPAEAEDLTLQSLTLEEWREQDEVMFKRLYETRRPIAFLKEIVNRKTGKAVPVSVTATLFDDDPEYDGVSLIYDLSDLFNAREEAEEYRRKADLALGATAIGLWDLNPETGEVNFDKRSRNIFGVSDEDILNFEHLSKQIPEDDVRKIQNAIRSVIASDCTISLSVEFRLHSPTAGDRIVSATGRSFRVRTSGELRVVGTLMDVTETKLFEQRILESEERFRTLAETIPQIVFTADEHGHVNYVNRKWYDFTGQRPNEAVTRDQIRQAIHPSDLPTVRERWRTAVREGRPFEIEYRMRSATGNYRWVIVRASPLLDRNGKTTRWFGSCTDIDSHRRLNDELWIERERAQKANQMKSSFLANMSHEIRTPLGAILGFTELLGDGSLTPQERSEYLGIVARNSRSLSRIVDDILDLSKVEAGLLTLEKIAFCPRILLKDIVTLFSERARRKGLNIELKIADEVPASLISDPMRIRQIIANLLSNSLKFTEQGHVSIEMNRAGDQICIAVDDTGAGISKENATLLFQPFVQGDDQLSRKHGGTGLGLHLSRKLAEALGGSLKLVPKSGDQPGSRFVFMAPFQEATVADADQWRNETIALQNLGVRDLDGVRILVVDDAPDNRKLIERLLMRTGAQVDFAENGSIGVASALDHHYDLILMDLQMPGIDGFEATQQIRDHHVQTPIVALTAHAVDEIRERCERAGFNGFLTKPVDSKSLMKVVKDLVGRIHTEKFAGPQHPI